MALAERTKRTGFVPGGAAERAPAERPLGTRQVPQQTAHQALSCRRAARKIKRGKILPFPRDRRRRTKGIPFSSAKPGGWGRDRKIQKQQNRAVFRRNAVLPQKEIYFPSSKRLHFTVFLQEFFL